MAVQIEVHLHTILRLETPDGVVDRLDLAVPAGSTLGDLLKRLDIDLNPEALLLVVNGRMAESHQVLGPGDVVNLMPAISGGWQDHLIPRDN